MGPGDFLEVGMQCMQSVQNMKTIASFIQRLLFGFSPYLFFHCVPLVAGGDVYPIANLTPNLQSTTTPFDSLRIEASNFQCTYVRNGVKAFGQHIVLSKNIEFIPHVTYL